MSGVWTRLNLNVELNIGHNRIGLACSRIGPDRSVVVGTGMQPRQSQTGHSKGS
jgi:hypothetical protein